MFGSLFITKTSKGLTGILHIIITASFQKQKQNQDQRGIAEKSRQSKYGYQIWIKAQGQKNHVCMYGLYHGNPGSRVLTSFVSYGLSNRGMIGHTGKGEVEVLQYIFRLHAQVWLRVNFWWSKDRHYDRLLTNYYFSLGIC